MAHVYTIKDVIYEIEHSYHIDRYEKLKKLGSPQIMLDAEKKLVEDIYNDCLKISGDTGALGDDYIDHEVKRSAKGQYISFNGGTVNYFPHARYGRCIYRKSTSPMEEH